MDKCWLCEGTSTYDLIMHVGGGDPDEFFVAEMPCPACSGGPSRDDVKQAVEGYAAARAHVEALVAAVVKPDPDTMAHLPYCKVCFSHAESADGEVHHADDCPVAAARRWLAGDGD